jgi:hypothetical protein
LKLTKHKVKIFYLNIFSFKDEIFIALFVGGVILFFVLCYVFAKVSQNQFNKLLEENDKNIDEKEMTDQGASTNNFNMV